MRPTRSSVSPRRQSDPDVEDEDQGDLPEKEIQTVMRQADASRGDAIRTLKRNKRDVVISIMVLGMKSEFNVNC